MLYPRYAIFLVSVVFLLVSPVLNAQDIVIKNTKINSAQTESVDILIQNGYIKSVSQKPITPPKAAKVIDAQGKISTAGIFNANTQLGLTEVSAVQETNDYVSENTRVSAAFKVSDAINPRSTLFAHNKSFGVTHAVVQPGENSQLFAGTAAIVNLADNNNIEKSEAALVVYLGAHGKKNAGGSRAVNFALLSNAFSQVKLHQKKPNQLLPISFGKNAFSLEDIHVIEKVLTRKLPLLVHVDRAIDIQRTLAFAKKHNVRLILAGVQEGWKVADDIAKAKAPVIMDPINNLPTSYDTLGARLDNAALLHKAGVLLLFTGMSWHSTHNAYLVRQSAGNAVANGLPYTAAIEAITINPATVFGLKRIGKITTGYQANIIVWSGDPLETIHAPEHVILQGKYQPIKNRSSQLRKRYTSLNKDS